MPQHAAVQQIFLGELLVLAPGHQLDPPSRGFQHASTGGGGVSQPEKSTPLGKYVNSAIYSHQISRSVTGICAIFRATEVICGKLPFINIVNGLWIADQRPPPPPPQPGLTGLMVVQTDTDEGNTAWQQYAHVLLSPLMGSQEIRSAPRNGSSAPFLDRSGGSSLSVMNKKRKEKEYPHHTDKVECPWLPSNRHGYWRLAV